MKKNILWDLDGTLTDPKGGILRSVRFALESAGYHAPPIEDLLWFIGPPLHESFPILIPGLSEADIWGLVEKYRERYRMTGLYENLVYPRIPAALKAMSGSNQYIATSKPHTFAQTIVDHFQLNSYFKKVYGSELTGERSRKGELISYLLKAESIDPKDAIMIGDRSHDVIGAHEVRMSCIGVTWGYGSRDELKKAGADWIVESPDELVSLLSTN